MIKELIGLRILKQAGVIDEIKSLFPGRRMEDKIDELVTRYFKPGVARGRDSRIARDIARRVGELEGDRRIAKTLWGAALPVIGAGAGYEFARDRQARRSRKREIERLRSRNILNRVTGRYPMSKQSSLQKTGGRDSLDKVYDIVNEISRHQNPSGPLERRIRNEFVRDAGLISIPAIGGYLVGRHIGKRRGERSGREAYKNQSYMAKVLGMSPDEEYHHKWSKKGKPGRRVRFF